MTKNFIPNLLCLGLLALPTAYGCVHKDTAQASNSERSGKTTGKDRSTRAHLETAHAEQATLVLNVVPVQGAKEKFPLQVLAENSVVDGERRQVSDWMPGTAVGRSNREVVRFIRKTKSTGKRVAPPVTSPVTSSADSSLSSYKPALASIDPTQKLLIRDTASTRRAARTGSPEPHVNTHAVTSHTQPAVAGSAQPPADVTARNDQSERSTMIASATAPQGFDSPRFRLGEQSSSNKSATAVQRSASDTALKRDTDIPRHKGIQPERKPEQKTVDPEDLRSVEKGPETFATKLYARFQALSPVTVAWGSAFLIMAIFAGAIFGYRFHLRLHQSAVERSRRRR